MSDNFRFSVFDSSKMLYCILDSLHQILLEKVSIRTVRSVGLTLFGGAKRQMWH